MEVLGKCRVVNSELLLWDKCCNVSSCVVSSLERVFNRGIGVIKKKIGKKVYNEGDG